MSHTWLTGFQSKRHSRNLSSSEDRVTANGTGTSEPSSPSSTTSSNPSTSSNNNPTALPPLNGSTSPAPPRKPSTFRRVPLRPSAANSRSPLPSSPLRPASTSTSTHSRTVSLSNPRKSEHIAPTHNRVTSLTSTADNINNVTVPAVPAPPRTSSLSHSFSASPTPSSTPAPTITSLPPSSPAPTPPPSLAPSPSPHPRTSAPYRPGFQPKGLYRPLTDDFLLLRQTKRSNGRIERTKLERRLEKLIQLHFPPSPPPTIRTKEEHGRNTTDHRRKRTTSLFDFDIRSITMDPAELWRGVVQSQIQGGKDDIRAAEQRITPWQDDADVAKCPLCTASFHPLTNRKHHCRLCGKIICSLPVKPPLRPVSCSILFVVDPGSRRIEEVEEGVDYGVRKRKPSAGTGKGGDNGEGEEEKFLKGVRICRECRPVLLRQQYNHEVQHVPTFVRLYEVFTTLEKEIEDSLPQFQELILTLSNEDQPTKEASLARKRLLEAFAQYDALAKRIRKLPCEGGPGSSQDRVQMAIVTRANLFLQKNMFPLQSLPKPKKPSSHTSSPSPSPVPPSQIDPDSQIAHFLQPLLEQEALLESFVEEAKAHRKFEDAKTLKQNLGEIRAEIDRVLKNAEKGGMGASGGVRGDGTTKGKGSKGR